MSETNGATTLGTVLVADPDAERAEALSETLSERGFTVKTSADGAAALESALTEIPDAVLIAPDLGVIDPPTLATLLRANPRTQRSRRVFLGETLPDAGGAFDDHRNPETDETPLADWLIGVVSEEARVEATWQKPESPREVEGQLTQIALTDLLELFHANRRTGRVELTRPGGGGREEFGTIWLRDGQPLEAKSGAVDGEKALFRLLTWTEGHFAFAPEDVVVVPRISTPLRGLLMEAMRQFDEWERQRSELPPLDARVKLRIPRDELPNVVQPITQEVLLLLELYDRVRDIVDQCEHPDYQVLRTLQALVDRELVELKLDPYGSTAPELGEGLLGPEEVGRLSAWLREGERQHRGKLVVVAASTEALADFLSVAASLPGAALSGEVDDGGGVLWERLMPLGSLTLDRELEIELWHVPIHERYRPVWPLVTWGALGAVLVSHNGVSVESLEPFRDDLGANGAVRLFHVDLASEKDNSEGGAHALEGTQSVSLPLEAPAPLEQELHALIHRLVP